jgi:hypothetical protein
MRWRPSGIFIVTIFLASAGAGRPGESSPASGSSSCVDFVVGNVQCANPEEACRLLLGDRDPHAGSNVDRIFDFRTQDLGDGTKAYVFAHRPGRDAYAFVPSFHFVRDGEKLALVFDGRGLPTTYLTDHPKVNGRYQIERTSRADIAGLYRKREEERWFWTGHEYAKAFSRVTIEQAKDPKLNGVTTSWNPETEELYRKAGRSWTHVVGSGDTLGAIAKRFGVPVEEIERQNDIRNAASLRIGQQLRFESWKTYAR